VPSGAASLYGKIRSFSVLHASCITTGWIALTSPYNYL